MCTLTHGVRGFFAGGCRKCLAWYSRSVRANHRRSVDAAAPVVVYYDSDLASSGFSRDLSHNENLLYLQGKGSGRKRYCQRKQCCWVPYRVFFKN
jgi:hypothetical protein